ncbi:hypothetical protein HW555_000453 [Spodoptera exigua]|uniref:Zinc finger PHD-type domain-containing protein n=1 Tax=Spodoptera exigua TaxID=7107 RepID=A0A835LC10_SPOEX|nr:hypothetical protein HW555_000453 [Spodoptera exigua]KAH9643345.1 hypothetical protein HF086_008832 [Spodoptera exigua]KAH9643439.1 hypothetical protein HF086_002558 [Spodoptera exigua]
MEIQNCGSCGDNVSEGVQCTVCNQYLHFQCSGVTEAGYRRLGDRKFTWRCFKCKQSNTPQPPSSPRPENESAILLEIRALSAKMAPLDNLKDEFSALRSEFAELKSSFHNQYIAMIDDLNNKINGMESRIAQAEKVQEQVASIRVRLEKLEEDSDNKDQWSRMSNVEVKGIEQTKNENLIDIIQKVGTKINYPIHKSQINFVTRVPTKDPENIKPIIVCFSNRYVKEDFIAAARYEFKTTPLTADQLQLKGKHRIYINDHLTTKNKNLLSKTKKAAIEANFRYVWVKHAKIHIRKTDTSPVIIIKSEKDLVKIV